MDSYTIQIKIKPFLKEYIEAEYGTPPVASLRNNFGNLIRPFLTKVPRDYVFKKLTGDDVLELIIPQNREFGIRFQTVYIPESSFNAVEQSFWALFSEIFVNYIDAALIVQPKVAKCIRQFISEKKITYSEELCANLKKKYYRSKKNGDISSDNKKAKINIHKLSQSSPYLFLF